MKVEVSKADIKRIYTWYEAYVARHERLVGEDMDIIGRLREAEKDESG